MKKVNSKTLLDSVQLAVITSRFQGIVKQMANTLFRTGRSGVINTAHDFSCCIITRDSDFLIMADSLPIHVMRGPVIMSKVLKEFHPVLRKGDAFFHNSPYHGNSHPGDFSVMVPVIDDNGEHHFTCLTKAHVSDIGCSLPTTLMAGARDVYEEGSLIFPAVKVQQDYKDIEDIIRMCMVRIRIPEQWYGDYLAILGAARTGERRILELGEEIGWETLHGYTQQWFKYSEEMMIKAINEMPSGKKTVTTAHDPFPGVPEGVPLKATVEIKSKQGIIEVDLRDNPDCVPSGINQSEACILTHSQIGVYNSIPHTVPTNAGSFSRIKIMLRENCCVGIPRHPHSCSVATTSLGNRIGSAVGRAIAEIGEGFGCGEIGAIMPPAFAIISGLDPRHGNISFINQLLLGCAGGSGFPNADGWLTIGDEGAMGMVHLDQIESDEFQYPIYIHSRHIIQDSEGAGTFRGAPGTYAEFGPISMPIEAMYASDGCINPALGARGGGPGGKAGQFKKKRSGDLEELDPMGPVKIEPGETIISIGAGGGGYGPPYMREVWRVEKDVKEGWISQKRAEEVYGVLFDDSGTVDEEATAIQRKRMKSEDDRE
ncbi:MAG: hydantoinase B/oxoprolinase family protein [Spirochaetota bacterium]|nr:MAG: hydantoinase B/oxoprolinase family protein [Spirochaetota bacterium]